MPLVAAAGLHGIIRIINLQRYKTVGSIVGHGHAINDIKFHPRQLNLLMSASKDRSIRLWNTTSNMCIAILGGAEGHRDEVLSIDFNLSGDYIISGGMDHALKLWHLNTKEFQERFKLSYSYNAVEECKPFPVIRQHFPTFTTRDMHSNYVDCVNWFGEFILSKSCENTIICWKPGDLNESLSSVNANTSATIVYEFKYDKCQVWFLRFGFNPWLKIMALGNQNGGVHIWELDPSDPRQTHFSTLNSPRCTSIVRQTAISRDGSILIHVCDDGTIWRSNRRH